MPSTYHLTLSVPPSANRYWRNVRGRNIVSEEGRVYKEQIGWEARAQGVHEELEGELAVRMKWYREAKRGDLDNRIKIPLDALQGIAYKNDSQVGDIHIERYEDPGDPRLEIELAPRWQEPEEVKTMNLILVVNLGTFTAPAHKSLCLGINETEAAEVGKRLGNACAEKAAAVVLPTDDNCWVLIPRPAETLQFAMATKEEVLPETLVGLVQPVAPPSITQALGAIDLPELDEDGDEVESPAAEESVAATEESA